MANKIKDIIMIYNQKIVTIREAISKMSRKRIFAMTVLVCIILSTLGYMFFNDEYEYITKINKEKEKMMTECIKCHTAGQSTVLAKDTIGNGICYNCHKEGVEFLIPVSLKVHTYHEGNRSLIPTFQPDYLSRHKQNVGSCDGCHIYYEGSPPDCTRCHVTGVHMETNKDKVCISCHNSTNNLFKHPSIREKLTTHNVFSEDSCGMCHSSDKIGLQLANGGRVSITTASKLCKQCHYQTYKEWSNGKHLLNIECTICHNPHSPKLKMSDLNITKERISKDEAVKQKEKTEERTEEEILKEALKKRREYEK